MKDELTREEINKAIIYYARQYGKQSHQLAVESAFLVPYFSSEPPKGLDPTFYHTLSYEGDMKQYERLLRLVRI